ncbi:hypothetical protein D3C85_1436190 [compost metagenome]
MVIGNAQYIEPCFFIDRGITFGHPESVTAIWVNAIAFIRVPRIQETAFQVTKNNIAFKQTIYSLKAIYSIVGRKVRFGWKSRPQHNIANSGDRNRIF